MIGKEIPVNDCSIREVPSTRSKPHVRISCEDLFARSSQALGPLFVGSVLAMQGSARSKKIHRVEPTVRALCSMRCRRVLPVERMRKQVVKDGPAAKLARALAMVELPEHKRRC
jgi:hypothetical protein